MASVTGSVLQILPAASDKRPVNLVLTADGIGATTVAGAYNVEIFTTKAGTPGAGFDAALFVQDAQLVNGQTTEIQAGTLASTEQLLATTLNSGVQVRDLTGGETILGGSGSNETIIGAARDTLIGGTGAGQMLDGSQDFGGSEYIIQPTGQAFVIQGASDTIVAASSGGLSGNIVANNSSVQLNPQGNYTISGSGNTITGASSSAQLSLTSNGSNKIDLTGDTGGATIFDVFGGANTIIGSGGANVVYAGQGDKITTGTGTNYLDLSGVPSGKPNVSVNIGASGSALIVGVGAGKSPAPGGNTITGVAGSTASVQIQSLGIGDSVNLSQTNGTLQVNATSGNDTVIAGKGSFTLTGGAGDFLVGGTGTGQIVGTAGSQTIVGGSGGAETITSGAGDSISALAGNAALAITGAAGDTVNLTGNTGQSVIDARAGNESVVGGTNTTIYGGKGDTITATNSAYIDAGSGKERVTLGTAGVDTVFGASGAGVTGNTIIGAGGAILSFGYAAGTTVGGGDLIDLTNSTGSATINAASDGNGAPDLLASNVTVKAGKGDVSVWGGNGDVLGVGNGASGTDLFNHSTTVVGSSLQFGSFDTVTTAVKYDTLAGTASTVSGVSGASTAHIQVGAVDTAGNVVGKFVEPSGGAGDFLFYQGETKALTDSIIATSQAVTITDKNGGHATNSTLITLPDGTTMTLVGIDKTHMTTSWFK